METLVFWLVISGLMTIVFFVAEMFIPSMGLLSVMGVLSLLTTVVLSFAAHFYLGLGLLILLACVAPFLPDWVANVYARTRMGRRVILNTTAGELDRSTILIGTAAVTLTEHRPMGESELTTGERVESKTELGRTIAAGVPVKVVALDGTTAIIRQT
jgi:membrane-bound serine protease (ClpP class)